VILLEQGKIQNFYEQSKPLGYSFIKKQIKHLYAQNIVVSKRKIPA